MKIELHRLILTNISVVNIDSESISRFGPYKHMSISSLEWIQDIDDEINIHMSDIGGKDSKKILSVINKDEKLSVLPMTKDPDIEIYLAEAGDLAKSIKLNYNEQIPIYSNDLPLILVKNYFPQSVYGGAEALFQIRIIDEV